MLTGVMFLPLEVMIRSFLRPVIITNPSASISPRSPLRSQPSAGQRLLGGGRLAVVALEHLRAADQDLAVGERSTRSVPGRRLADGAEA